MKLKSSILWIILCAFLLVACSEDSEKYPPISATETSTSAPQNDPDSNAEETTPTENSAIKILTLGDSYTLGVNVCSSCGYPEQLKARLNLRLTTTNGIELKVIAQSRWTTTNLINAINSDNLSNYYDLVTLLIGVNNQYQEKPFSLYEREFPLLVNTAIAKANSNKNKVIVISIPDYAYTPFGRGNINISKDIEKYNTFAKNYCAKNNISYINITDITQEGLNNPALVTFDGLHPSELAYSKFVDRIYPKALSKLN